MKKRLKILTFLLVLTIQSCLLTNSTNNTKKYKTIISWHDSINNIPERVFISKKPNDKLNGLYYYYNIQGNIYLEIPLVNGFKHGISKTYHNNRKLNIKMEKKMAFYKVIPNLEYY